MATARAAAQDKIEPQRRRHACSTRFLSRNLSERALSWASRQHDQPGTSSSCDQFRVRALLPSASCFQSHSVSACRIASPFVWRALATVVSTANWTLPNIGESINHNFQTARVMHIWSSQIHVAHHDVGGDSTPCFAADTGCDVLHCESLPLQNPSTSTSCAVVATGIEWKATPAVAPGQREGKAKTTNEKDSEQVRFQTGDPTQRARGQSSS